MTGSIWFQFFFQQTQDDLHIWTRNSNLWAIWLTKHYLPDKYFNSVGCNLTVWLHRACTPKSVKKLTPSPFHCVYKHSQQLCRDKLKCICIYAKFQVRIVFKKKIILREMLKLLWTSIGWSLFHNVIVHLSDLWHPSSVILYHGSFIIYAQDRRFTLCIMTTRLRCVAASTFCILLLNG